MTHNHTVLVVDDEPDVIKSIQDLLRLQYRVLGATTPQMGIEILAQEEVQVILTDQRMPGMTGVELLRHVFDHYPDIIRLLLTGYADLPAIIEAINIGHLHRYLTKPWNPDELQTIIRESCALYDRSVVQKNQRNSQVNGLPELSRERIARAEELDRLGQLTAEMTGHRNYLGLLDLVARIAMETLGARSCAVYTLNPDRTLLLLASTVNLSGPANNSYLLAKCAMDQEALASGLPILAAGAAANLVDPRRLQPGPPREEGLCSVLVVPLVWNRIQLGVLHVHLDRGHEASESEVQLAGAIATEAAYALAQTRQHADEFRLGNLKRAMALSARVYEHPVPVIPLRVPGFEISTAYVPVEEWGGDYYDFVNLPPHSVGLILGNMAEPGSQAPLLMAFIRAGLCCRHALNRDENPELLTDLNRELMAYTTRYSFTTLFCGLLDFTTRRLSFANLGSHTLMLFRAGGMRYLCDGVYWGGNESGYVFTPHGLTLLPGDLVLVCTDGILEATNGTGESFGEECLRKSVLASLEEGVGTDIIVRQTLADLNRFAGPVAGPADATVMAIKAL